MVDGAITKFNFQEKVSIGLVISANDLYSETDAGYFLDNAKKASDEEAIVNFFYKKFLINVNRLNIISDLLRPLKLCRTWRILLDLLLRMGG